MNQKTKDLTWVLLWTTLFCFLLALIPMCAQAAPPTSATMARWQRLNDACRGAPDKQAICTARDKLSASFEASGWEWHNHEVWTSPHNHVAFVRIVTDLDKAARGLSPSDLVAIGPYVRATLRAAMPDESIVALWNEYHLSVRDYYPRAWTVLSEQLEQIVADHSRMQDVRYSLDY